MLVVLLSNLSVGVDILALVDRQFYLFVGDNGLIKTTLIPKLSDRSYIRLMLL